MLKRAGTWAEFIWFLRHGLNESGLYVCFHGQTIPSWFVKALGKREKYTPILGFVREKQFMSQQGTWLQGLIFFILRFLLNPF